MNALRKLLSRAEFTPHEVAALGYKRLKMAEGIGSKGLERIVVWLQQFGLEPSGEPPAQPKPGKAKRLERALSLLEANGFTVQPAQAKNESTER